MPEDAGSAFTGTFNSVYGAYLNSSKMQLQEQANKLEQYSTLGKIVKSYDEVDPAVGQATLSDFLQQMKIEPEKQKLFLDSVKNMSAQKRQGAVDALNEAGLQPSAPNVQTLLQAGPANMYIMLGQMRAAKGQNAVGEALNEQSNPSSGGASPPAGSPAPAASPTAAPAAPPGQLEAGNINLNNRPVVKNSDGSVSTVRSIGINDGGKEVVIPTVSDDGRVMSNDEAVAQYRSSGKHLGKFDTVDNANAYGQKLHEAQATQYAPPAAPMPPAVQAAVGAPPATAMPGMPDGHAAPDATHPVTDTPAYAAAAQYDKMMRAATRLESNRNPDGSVKPSYPEQAQKLRDEAEKVSKGAVVNIPYDDPRVKNLHALPGTIFSYNTATRQLASVQAGHETWNVLDKNDPKYAELYARQTPGTVITQNAQTGQYATGVTGVNMTTPATPAQLKAMNIDPASVQPGTAIMTDSTGKATTQQLVPEQEVPVTTQRRAELNASGANLDPNYAYSENKTTKKLSVIQTGATGEKERVRLSAVSDQKELDEQRSKLDSNSSIIQNNAIIRNLAEKFKTGPAGNVKLLLGQVADQFNIPIPKGLDINTKEGEALRSTLGNRVVDQAMTLTGQKSGRELEMLKSNAGTLALTTDGNILITKISDHIAGKANTIANLANSWDGALSDKASSGPYAGLNYYQAKAKIQSDSSLPPELSQELNKQVDRIKEAKAILPKLSTATPEDLETLKQYKGIMTLGERKKARARAIELGVND